MTLVEALARVWSRALYNESLDEQHGFNRGRASETESMYVVLDVLSEAYGDAVAEAEEIAREQHERRRGTP